MFTCIMLTLLSVFGSSMEQILERYERYSYAERQLIASDPDSTVWFKNLILFYLSKLGYTTCLQLRPNHTSMHNCLYLIIFSSRRLILFYFNLRETGLLSTQNWRLESSFYKETTGKY